MDLSSLLCKCRESGNLNRDEITFLLSLDGQEEIERLATCADEVRRLCCGDDIQIRALVEFSNTCGRQCNYCGLRAPNTKQERYRMSPDQITRLAVSISNDGPKTIVLQSGEDSFYTGEVLADIVHGIKSQTDLAVTLSVGERSTEDYKLWKEAGADRFLLRHETANGHHYEFMHPDSRLANRVQCLHSLRELGYQVGAGCMVGSPGQTLECLVDDIEFLRDFQPDMAGVGPYIAHPDTPFAAYPNGSVELTLKMVSLTRIITRNALLPATTAIGTIHPKGREMALQAGADVVMPNYTPTAQRRNYAIYPGKHDVAEDTQRFWEDRHQWAEGIGRTVSQDHGNSRKSL